MGKESRPSVPKEAQVMGAILRDMGITEYEPGVINQMLEFSFRYVTQVFEDARVFANYSKKAKPIEVDDIKLAIHMQVEQSFTTPPPRDLLLDLARTRNANPLPPIKSQNGIRLPPDRYCLSGCSFKLLSANTRKGHKVTKTPLTVVTKPGSGQTVTLVQKPINAAAPQKVVSVTRPVIKVTPGASAGGGGGSNTTKLEISSASGGILNVPDIKQEDGGGGGVGTGGVKRKHDDEEFGF